MIERKGLTRPGDPAPMAPAEGCMIGWQDETGDTHRGSLFAAFAALADGQARSFPALRPHQREPWHAFTVQVAALALIHAGTDTLPTTEAAWRDLLLALTPNRPEAWELVVDDWSKPALLQPPTVQDADRHDYKKLITTPDALDMLLTSRNHDVKTGTMRKASSEHWLFALVTLQTYEGYLGSGNYGISRMNSGYGSRMSFGIRPGGSAARAFSRDVARIFDDAKSRPDRRTGDGLLWTIPWNGTLPLDYDKLDELYVEVCRRVRLRQSGEVIEALAAGSKGARVAAADLKGNTLDPWAPMKADASSSHPPTIAGFGYRQMATLLDARKIAPPLLAKPNPADPREELTIVAAALVRGEGKTEGLHRRTIRTPGALRDADGNRLPLDQIGKAASTRAEEAGEAGKQLRRALISLVQGGPDRDDLRLDDDASNKKVRRWVNQFDSAVDAEFFDDPFWAEVAGTAENARLEWRTRLRALASATFELAAAAAPHTEVRRIRARVRARSFLDGQMDKWVEKAQYGE